MTARILDAHLDPSYLAQRRAESRRIVCPTDADDVPPETLRVVAWRLLRQHGASARQDNIYRPDTGPGSAA